MEPYHGSDESRFKKHTAQLTRKKNMPSSYRLYFLDNLRAFVILLVIVLHASMTYMAYAPVWWYVVNPQNSLFFTMLVLLIDVPIMQIMFFVSGYFAVPSLQKRGSVSFLKDKWVRIGIPWVLGSLFLAPPIAYLTYYSRNVPMGFLQFWQTDFWTKLYQQSVYWYLGILFLFFTLLALVYHWNSRLKASSSRITRPSWILFIGFAALMTACFLVINLFFNLDDWKNLGYIFVFQPLRLPLYAGYFLLGIYAQQHAWFSAEGYKPGIKTWVPASILSGLIYLGFRLSPAAASSSPDLMIKLITAVLFNAFCLTSLMAALAVFEARVNGKGFIWRSQSACSYGMYYFHPLILYPLAYVFVAVSMPLELKALTVILLGTVLSWLFTSQIALKVPLLRDMF